LEFSAQAKLKKDRVLVRLKGVRQAATKELVSTLQAAGALFISVQEFA
jgi:hypothetical protein